MNGVVEDEDGWVARSYVKTTTGVCEDTGSYLADISIL